MLTNAINFTKKTIKDIKPTDTTVVYYDRGGMASVRGLTLEVTKLGTKPYKVRKKKDGKRYTKTLGYFPAMTIEEARREALNYLNQIENGMIGQSNTHVDSISPLESQTLNTIFDMTYTLFRSDIEKNKVTEGYVSRIYPRYNTYVKPVLGHLPISSISPSDAQKFMDNVFRSTSYAIHNQVLTLIKSSITRVLGPRYANPFSYIKKINEDPYTRTRTYSQAEFIKLFASLEHEKQIYQDFVHMLIITGQRKSTVVKMQWRDIDFDNKVWVLRALGGKQNKLFGIPLEARGLEILERRYLNREANDVFVFPSKVSLTGHISVKGGEGGFWRRTLERAGLNTPGPNKLCMHDLRRSVGTRMVSCGHSLQATSKMLAHSDITTTAKVYAHLDLDNVRTAINSTLSTIYEPRPIPTNVNLEELKQAINSLPDPEKKAFIVQLL